MGQDRLIIEASRSHSDTQTLGWTPLDEWSVRRRDLYLTDNVKHEQATDVHVLGEIRTYSPSKGAATGSTPTFYTKI